MLNVYIYKLVSKVFILIFGLFLGTSFSYAQTSENILDYHVDLHINADSSINVVENINYDFAGNAHHGIFRDIIYKYQARGGTFKLRISNISVTSPDLGVVPFKTSTSGNTFHIQIGDANKLVTGIHQYNIAYTVNRAINYFDDHDELYWNVIGGNWQVFIQKSSASFSLPGDAKPTQVACFHGSSRVSGENCNIENQNITSQTPLGNGLGLTVVIGVPKGLITKPTWLTEVKYILEDNWIFGLPVLVFIFAFTQWWRKGRDPKGKTTIVPQYEPLAGLSPIESGTIVDAKTDQADISAEIIYLAQQGYLTITRLEVKKLIFFSSTDYSLSKTNKDTQGLNDLAKQLLGALFTTGDIVTLSELGQDHKFGSRIKQLLENGYKKLADQGYFTQNLTTVWATWMVSGAIMFVLTILIFSKLFGAYGTAAGILSGVILIVNGFIMPARTQKGVEAKTYILGLKLYLSVAEKARLEFHNAPEKNPQHFETLLPYAIALGVATSWAEQFKDIPMNAPSWYNDPNNAGFNAMMFSNNLNAFSTSVASAQNNSVSSASGGGSGFSGGGGGGGFGGGGGGSW